MAKGGRYLNTNKKQKKKAGGLKVFLIIVVILALLAVGGYLAFRLFMGSMLGNVNRAEVIEQNSDKSYEDLIAELYGSMEQSGGEAEEDPEEDLYLPEPQPQETTEAQPTEPETTAQ